MTAAVDVDALVLAIAEKFAEHRMREHLAGLRGYYRARRQRKLDRVRAKRPPWDEDLVLHWAALWRIPPLENAYPQLPRPHCPCPRASESNSFTAATFPEAVDRRTAAGRRGYAILALLITYGLRGREVAAMTLDVIDWKRERFRVPERKRRAAC